LPIVPKTIPPIISVAVALFTLLVTTLPRRVIALVIVLPVTPISLRAASNTVSLVWSELLLKLVLKLATDARPVLRQHRAGEKNSEQSGCKHAHGRSPELVQTNPTPSSREALATKRS